jgi:hypothetical protein
MIQILSQPPNDQFTSRLFFQLIDTVSEPFDAFYVWSLTLAHGKVELFNISNKSYDEEPEYYAVHRDFYWNYIQSSIKNNLVIIAIKDHLTSDDFNPWYHAEPTLITPLTDIFEAHADKKFILITSLENLESYVNYKNVSIVPWGGDITNQMIEYKRLPNILEKNLESNTTFLTLNRNNRTARRYFLSFLLGLNLKDHGLISCMFRDELPTTPTHTWDFASQEDIKEVFEVGYQKLLTTALDISDSIDIYPEKDNDNYNNFLSVLTPYYQNTFIEFINETSYTETAFLVTEKTANCFYGCSFPIWISSPGIVKFLRTLGLDVFDDVIDHSYDNELHPIRRMYLAISNNMHLLNNPDLVKKLWSTHKDRFSKNINFLQNELYDIYYQRAFIQFINRR